MSHDSIVRHPFLQFFIGFVLVAAGIILSIAAFIIDEAGVYLVRMQSQTFGVPVAAIVLVLMIWFGLRLLAQVLKGRYNFLITTEKGNCKIKFEQSANIRDILSFVKKAELEFGYDVDMSITQQMHFPSDEA